jgi:type III secretion protein L
LNAAEIEAETIRREAYRDGREQAEQELAGDLFEIKQKRAQVLSEVEADVLRLAVKLAEKIIGREVEASGGAARGEIVVNALRAARAQETLTVRVSAADLPALERMRAEKNNAFGRAQFIDFVADQAVANGGCIIESQSGTIDARIETQLRILENALLGRVASEN